ncbi:MAG: adenylate/guanylate cyclase domain-containing protein [Caldilineaceae bacterium]
MLNRLSVKSKLVLLLLAVSLVSALVVGILGWRSSRAALSSTILENMTALRRNRADQITAYFRHMRYTVEVLSEDDMVVEAMVRFNRAFRQLENSTIPAEWDQALDAYYTSQFFPRLFANLPGQADYNLYRPQNQAGLHLQYQYIVANRFDIGEKLLLDSADDESDYSKVHAYYHPRLRNIMRKYGFYDLFLVSFETGDIVYTVAKEADYASNLDQGPFRRSNLADALELVRNNTERGTAQLIDFALYRPSYGAPAAFWAAPLYNGNHLVGVLVAQISLDTINQIMTSNQQWAQAGLGATGETYLVGADRLLRSDLRPRIEDPAAYQTTLTDLGVAQRTIELIRSFDTTILLQEIDSPVVTAALQNQEGTEFTTNYLHRSVLSSYQPLVLEGLQWALVAEMDADEAYAPVSAFQRQLLVATVLMIVMLAFLAVGIAYLFMRPVNLLVAGARSVDSATVDSELSAVAVKIHSHDEWGELATTFNEMAQGVHQQRVLLRAKEQEVTQLLHNLLPMSAVQRMQQGETEIVEQAPQVTICYLRIGGVTALAQQKAAPEVAALLQDLMTDVNEAAGRYDLEQLPAPDQRLIAVCGLSTPHLDHSRRTVDFALALRTILQRLNTRYQGQLKIYGGVHSGPLSGAVLHGAKMRYELWGEIVAGAQQLSTEAEPDQILVAQPLYDRLQEQYTFQRPVKDQSGSPRTGQRGTTPPTAWVVVGARQEGGA